jgi:hypothetical protein
MVGVWMGTMEGAALYGTRCLVLMDTQVLQSCDHVHVQNVQAIAAAHATTAAQAAAAVQAAAEAAGNEEETDNVD